VNFRKLYWSGPAIVLTLAATLSGCGGGGSSEALAPVSTLVPIVSVTPTPAPAPASTPKPARIPKPTVRPSKTAKPAGADQGVVMLDIKDFMFSPQTVKLRVGQTLVVTNQDTAIHTITSDDGSFDSGNLAKGESFRFTPTKAGTYTYFCDLHQYMTGTIEVS
jgi:plastocyanin